MKHPTELTGMEDLTDADAAVIVAGMRLVAKADGDIHPNELALVEELGKDLPLGDPNTQLSSEPARLLYIRTLGMLALADGVLSAPEVTLIRELAHTQGLDHAHVDGALRDVKRTYFERFAGVRHYKDSARSIGEALGLSEEDIEDILSA